MMRARAQADTATQASERGAHCYTHQVYIRGATLRNGLRHTRRNQGSRATARKNTQCRASALLSELLSARVSARMPLTAEIGGRA